jgi:hypothetical protein
MNLIDNEIQYFVIIKARVKPGIFSQHLPTVINFIQKNRNKILLNIE